MQLHKGGRSALLLFLPHNGVTSSFLMSFDRIYRDIHKGAAYLNNSCLVRLQHQTILNLDQGAKLGQLIINSEFFTIKLYFSVLPGD